MYFSLSGWSQGQQTIPTFLLHDAGPLESCEQSLPIARKHFASPHPRITCKHVFPFSSTMVLNRFLKYLVMTASSCSADAKFVRGDESSDSRPSMSCSGRSVSPTS